MKLIVGLGNIGEKYKSTYHNVGFMVLDKVSEKLGFKFGNRGCDADYAEYRTFSEKFIFAKPRTFMNDSGRAVKSFMKKFKLEISDVLVVVDDIDQPAGNIRLRKTGSAGTHNGLKSIIYETGEEDFMRLRVGIGKQHEGQDLADYVLSDMRMTEAQKSGLENAVNAVIAFTEGESFDSLMTRFNPRADKNGK